MGRARDIASLLTTSSVLATDAEVASLGYLTNSSASSIYQTLTGNNNSYRNKLINGDFNIWQRGTSFTQTTLGTGSAASYSADRWQTHRAGDPIQVTRQTSGLTGFQYCARIQRTASNSKATGVILSQVIETANSIPLAGQTFTLSFYARSGANFSSASNALIANIITGTGTDQSGYDSVIPGTGGFTGTVRTALNQTFNITTSWVRYTATATFNADTNEIAVRFYYIPSGTAGADDWFEITGIQLELGSTATPYETISISDELAQCERYLQVWKDDNKALYSGHYWSATESLGTLNFRVSMRIAPTLTVSSGTAIKSFDGVGQVQRVSSSINTDASSTTGIDIAAITAASTAGRATFNRTNGAGSYLWLSAEL